MMTVTPLSPTLTPRHRVAVPPTAALPQIGDAFAHFRILKRLGEGGMGVVYKGTDQNLRRPVALKLLRPELAADPTSRRRFAREARAAAALMHDHVVTIFHVGEANGLPFLAMQYLSGVSLYKYLADLGGKPFSPVQAVRVGAQVAEGLAAAHALGLVHRDIKPSNVWLEAPAGRVKLLDFGIAKLVGGDADGRGLTAPGVVMGTPAYMSPEQARGKPTDHRSDLFSLGAVLYEVLTGKSPFARGTGIETLAAVSEDAVPPADIVNPAVPGPLAGFVERLLSKDPAGRPQTAAAAAKELRRLRKTR